MMNFCNVFSSLHETINGGNIFELASEFGQAHYEEQIDDVSQCRNGEIRFHPKR